MIGLPGGQMKSLERKCSLGSTLLSLQQLIGLPEVFTEQGLPANLLKRVATVTNSSQPSGLKLLIEDYPYAVDRRKIWATIEAWFDDYCPFYYLVDDMIQDDTELQSWWKEVCEKGDGDLKNELWWPQI